MYPAYRENCNPRRENPRNPIRGKLAETIKRASPVAWQNINLRGTYLFDNDGKMPKLEDLMATIEGYLPAEAK